MKENYFMGMDGFVWFTGVVEDRNDPSKLGRVKVRCLGLHTESLVDIPTEDLPWAHIMQSTNNPSMQGLGNTPSFLVEGTWVVGFFLDAVEKQQPLIMGTLPGVPQAVADKTKGFNDPNGTYPSEKITHSNHSIEESDVNRLARNDTDYAHAVVVQRTLRRLLLFLLQTHLPLGTNLTLRMMPLIRRTMFWKQRVDTSKNMTIPQTKREYTSITRREHSMRLTKTETSLQE